LVYQESCEKVKEKVKKAKTKFFKDKIENCKGDQKKLFQIVNSLLGRSNPTLLPSSSSTNQLVETFNSFFISKIANIRQDLNHLENTISPLSCPPVSQLLLPCHTDFTSFPLTSEEEVCKIVKNSSKSFCTLDPFPTKLIVKLLPELGPAITKIINLALSSGQFPPQLKSALVKPLIKKPSLDCELLKNYRPVSNLSFLSKLIEKVIATRLFTHMKDNNLLEKMQSAYKPGHSCETALLRIQNDLLHAIDKGKGCLLVLLDLSAAFDTVDYHLLLQLLESHLHVKGSALQLLRSYLTGRTQCVSISGIQSELVELLYGVPQGSVLGPIKFCIYTLPLGAILRFHDIEYHVYADDTQLYLAFDLHNDPDPSLSKLCSAIADVRSWMISNKLKINDDKTEFVILSSRHHNQPSNLQLQIGGVSISPSLIAKNLGVTFDSSLCMDKHVTNICRSCLFHLWNIGSVRHMLSDEATAQLIHSLVSSRMDFCNSLLYGLPDCAINRIQRVQNIAARILTLTPKASHITPVLKDLHWLPIRSRILFIILLLTYRAVHKLAPEYLCDLLAQYSPHRSLRSSRQLLLREPRTKLKTYGDRSFQAAGTREWNKLPLGIREATSLSNFKHKLKTHLFKCHYNV